VGGFGSGYSAFDRTLSLREHPLYALRMKRVRALFERLRGGRRPPTGPLTTSEKATADELRTQTSLKDSELSKHEHEHEHEERR
jgi:hypothetical protein